MFTNQRVLGVLLVVFIIGAGIYFTVAKFKQEVGSVAASPSPSNIEFLPQQNQQPQSSELPLAKTKKLPQFPGILNPEILQNKAAVIATRKGIIAIQIYPEASMAASNFLLLSANGFYDGLTFHRVEPGFVVQGGDPLGNGTGGPGYIFPDEAVNRDYNKGIVAMANSGPNTNGSQFFILLSDHPELPKKYTIFGQVISGMDVLEKIGVGDVMQKVTVQNLQ